MPEKRAKLSSKVTDVSVVPAQRLKTAVSFKARTMVTLSALWLALSLS